MNTFVLEICVFICLINLNQANVSVSWTVSHEDFTYYIAGGKREPRTFELAKYLVSIRTRNPQKYFGDNHFCAGTIISKTAVLTSAHCVMDKRRVLTRARRLLLVAGTPNRLEPNSTTIQFPVKSIVANTNFVRNNKNDIAIVHLKYEIPDDNDNIKILKLATKPPVFNSTCTVLGWGRILMKGPLAALPFHINVRIQPPEECRKVLKENYNKGVLCAIGSDVSDEDPCRGDTGGPLICNEELTGIISWTLGCGIMHMPSLYTDVFHHTKWIEDHLNAASSDYVETYYFLSLAIIVFIQIN